MIFKDKEHAELWLNAVEKAGAINKDTSVNSYFGASLFIITGVSRLYEEAKKFIYNGWIDFESILNMGLSSGERILIAIAGNLYNGGFFNDYTPIDIVAQCDKDTLKLVTEALILRSQRITTSIAYDYLHKNSI